MALIEVPVFYQGDGIPVNVEMFEDDGITPRPLSDFINIYVEVYYFPSGKPLKRFAMIAQEGFDDANFIVVDDLTGKAQVICQPSVMAVADPGEYACRVKKKTEDDRFEDDNLPITVEEKVFVLKSNNLRNA